MKSAFLSMPPHAGYPLSTVEVVSSLPAFPAAWQPQEMLPEGGQLQIQICCLQSPQLYPYLLVMGDHLQPGPPGEK